jgi:hypothetical protein
VTSLSGDASVEIVTRLVVRTESGKLKWSKFEGTDEYEATSDNFSYYIKSRDDDTAPPYILELWKKTPQSPGPSQVQVGEIVTSGSSPVNQPLARLYDRVRLSILGITDLRDDVLRDLSD